MGKKQEYDEKQKAKREKKLAEQNALEREKVAALMARPLVSVIMSTYHRPMELKRAIQSVIAQTYLNWELIVVDDHSPYENWQEVVNTLPNDPRIQYHRLEKNHGKDTKPKNMGIMASKGEYICYLDDDCEFRKRHIERLVDEIEASKADVVYADQWLEGPEGQRMEGIAMDFNGQYLLKKNYIDTNEVLHTREAIFAIGGWDETLPRFVDWNVWVRMMKHGFRFRHVPEKLGIYHISKKNSATAHPVRQWPDPFFGVLFEPTFDPAGCYIYLPYLGNDRLEEIQPSVAVFTLSYDRLEYTSRFFKTLRDTAGYGKLHWYVIEQGSKDGSVEWLQEHVVDFGASGTLVQDAGNPKGSWVHNGNNHVFFSPDNLGITLGSNKAIDEIKGSGMHDIIIKIDNDTKFMTLGWLADMVDLWKRNHLLYVSPYVEGLVHNPGGAPRVGHAKIGPYFVEVTQHVGGIFAMIDAHAYDKFRWQDQFLHGNQDAEASRAFTRLGYMPMYLPIHRIEHSDGTEGQIEKFPDYFERRKKEKTQVYGK